MHVKQFGMINMATIFNFYVKMDGETYGPYSAKQVVELELLDDVMVTEESMNGEWLPAAKFDFDDMVKKESGYSPESSSAVINEYGEVQRSSTKPYHSNEQVNSTTAYSNQTTSSFHNQEQELNKWNWGAFFFNWIWGVCNGVYWPLILIVISFIPYAGGLISLVICVILGMKGNQMAWSAKQGTTTFYSFMETQKKWSKAALWVFCISLALGLLIGIAAAS